ncbi:MAG: hypothetical protein ABFR05_04770 [Bacteroidota bacterium]
MEENKEKIMNPSEPGKELTLSVKSINFLTETGNWMLFFAILGFLGVGFMVLIGLFAGSIFAGIGSDEMGLPFPGMLFGVIYIVLAGLYVMPIIYLYNFSVKIKKALTEKNDLVLEEAFKNLKSHYKYVGVFTIVMFSVYLIIGIGAGVFGILA